MTPSLYANLKNHDEELEDICDLMMKLSKETPLLSGMGMNFALKSKTRTKMKAAEFEAIKNFGILEYPLEIPLYEEFPGGITPYMLDIVWVLM
jgi:hypothetical protein